jgi:hypothetical protein
MAVSLLLQRLGAEAVAPGVRGPAVELLGWLELALDDAVELIVVGMNEGHVPGRPGPDAMLPEALRRRLGLPTSADRAVRDRYVLEVLCRTGRRVTLISGRVDTQGQPMLPSRLLLGGGPDSAARRLLEHVDAGGARGRVLAGGSDASPSAQLSASGDGAPQVRLQGLGLPRPAAGGEAITRLPVTAFRDYLACPYRFYLKRVLRLEGLDDREVEMDGGTFGSIAHAVLQDLGGSDLTASEDAGRIAAYLNDRLHHRLTQRYGLEPPRVIALQAAAMIDRLGAFAQWQARAVREGWRIDQRHRGIEVEHRAELDVDGEPFEVYGRIDRIDVHPELGYRVLDYKTSETAVKPEQAHRQKVDGVATWVDLQLPLYGRLAAGAGCDGPVAVGYVRLPRTLGDVGWVDAGWDGPALEEAMATAEQVVRGVRAGTFWPPGPASRYDDGLAGLCLDGVADRDARAAGGGDVSAGGGS